MYKAYPVTYVMYAYYLKYFSRINRINCEGVSNLKICNIFALRIRKYG